MRYREKFGLSYRDFMDEPYEDFMWNSEIMSIENDIEAKMAKRSKKR